MATIYCFTSTGNSLYTAKKIAGEIGGKVLPMRDESVTCEDNVVGFVFPVYFWGLPRIVAHFITQLRITKKDAYVFAVITCAGSFAGVPGQLQKLLKPKGITLSYGTGLVTVSTYLPAYQVNDSESRRKKIDDTLRRIIENIKNRETNRASSFTAFNTLINKILPDQSSDQYFTVSSKCTGCGTCQKICTVNNIVMKDGKPCFQHKCEHCLSCLHSCPTRAIDWKQKTQGKNRYRHFKIGLDELISFSDSPYNADQKSK